MSANISISLNLNYDIEHEKNVEHKKFNGVFFILIFILHQIRAGAVVGEAINILLLTAGPKFSWKRTYARLN